MTRPAKPGDKVFCADRAWDQRTETGFMKWAEDNFQILADEIADGRNDPLSGEQNHAVSMFYAMWYIRSRQRDLPDQFVPMHGAQGETLSKNELEILESKGVMALRADGTMAARHINGLQIQLEAARIVGTQLKGSQWGIIRCQSGEFIVPDVPIHKLIPITPFACLVDGPTSGNISGENVSSINRDIAFSSQKYFFGRNLNGWGFLT